MQCLLALKGAHLQQLVWSIGGSNAQLLEQLHKEATEALERTRKPHLRVHLNQHVFPGVYIQGLRQPATG